MNNELIRETARKIAAGSIAFPQVVAALLEAGVEYYHVDYVALTKTCYGSDGAVLTTPLGVEDLPPVAVDFDDAGLKANLIDSQRHGQHFRDFTRRAMQAGVQGYTAFLRGKRVIYLGRQGDQHVEWFPGAAPAARQ